MLSRPAITSRTENAMIASSAIVMIIATTGVCVCPSCNDFHERREVIVVAPREALDFVLLAPERFDDALALQHLGQVARKIRDAFLRAFRARGDQSREERDDEIDDRREHEEKEREQPVDVEHVRDRSDERHERDEELR